jgi:glutathione S-transferase
MSNSQIPRLITIAISHYCEKVRWALDWLNLPYQEESHAPPFHRKYTRLYNGTTVPVLATQDRNFVDSTEILHYLDSISSDKRLYPSDRQLREEVDSLEELFDTQLGINSRRLGYSFLLKKPLIVPTFLGINTPWIEKIGCAIAFPITLQRIKKIYEITPENATKSLEEIREVFRIVERKLAQGNKYLVGDNFSAADLTFAALASPLIRPKNHPFYSPKMSNVSKELAAIVLEFRTTLAGEFALRLYREHRNK